MWGKIFGTDKYVEKGLSIIESAGDKLWYTDEEKADDRAKKGVAITFVWLSMYIISTLMGVVAPWLDSTVQVNDLGAVIEGAMSTYEKTMASSAALDSKADRMSGAVMLILAFYFAAPHMDKIVVGALEKFGGSKFKKTDS